MRGRPSGVYSIDAMSSGSPLSQTLKPGDARMLLKRSASS